MLKKPFYWKELMQKCKKPEFEGAGDVTMKGLVDLGLLDMS